MHLAGLLLHNLVQSLRGAGRSALRGPTLVVRRQNVGCDTTDGSRDADRACTVTGTWLTSMLRSRAMSLARSRP